jgi:diguanylate cyclase (GGDEF)-like protein/PAS domain S-box-containing protein
MPAHRFVPRKAIALGLSIGMGIIGIAVKTAADLREETWQAALRSSRDVGVSISHDIQRSIESYDLSLQSVVTDLKTAGVMELSDDIRHRVLFDSSVKAKYLGPISVVDIHGRIYLDSSSVLAPPGDFSKREFFQFHRTHQDLGLHIGRPYRGADGVARVSLSRRLVMEDGEFAGVVVGSIELAYFEDLFARIDLGGISVLSLILDDGTMLMRSPHRDGDVGRSLKGTMPFETMVARRQGDLTARAVVDSVERQYVFCHVGTFPLVLTVAQSVDGIYEAWHQRVWVIVFFTISLLSGCATLALILQRELQRREAVESELFTQGERLHVMLESIADAVLSTDAEGRVLYMNTVAERMSGWSSSEALGRSVHDVLQLAPDPAVKRFLHEAGEPGIDLILRRQDGGQSTVEESVAPIHDRQGATIGAVTVLRDVTQARALTRRMSHLAQHDALTDLPNRILFRDRLVQAIDLGHRDGRKAAVMFLDLDRFKVVNDSLGHRVGDQLLVEVARRLKTCVRESDTVSRQGGDEFVILISDLVDEQGPARTTECILRHFASPFVIEGHTLTVTASVGVAIYPDDGTDSTELMRNADAAMYLAKQSGRNVCRFFTSGLGDQAQRRLQVEQKIAEGIRNEEFVLYYQPLCNAADGLPFGAEALVRWIHEGRVVPPDDFIPVAEESGQIIELGDVILAMACRQSAIWNQGRAEPFAISVNVSAHQFRSSGFVDRVRRALAESRLDPRCLELEMTETVLLHAVDHTEVTLRQLKEIGVSIALDDFGMGYSSLSYLSRFPVDRIKIDRSFTSAIATNRRDRSIVQAIITLGQDLGLHVVAEGVETVDQRKTLRAMGCQEMQGFLFGQPRPSLSVGLDAFSETT